MYFSVIECQFLSADDEVVGIDSICPKYTFEFRDTVRLLHSNKSNSVYGGPKLLWMNSI